MKKAIVQVGKLRQKVDAMTSERMWIDMRWKDQERHQVQLFDSKML